MKCRDWKCRKGEIDETQPIAGYNTPHLIAYPCNVCGRLHWGDGSLVDGRSNSRAFLKDNKVINVRRNGKVYIVFKM